MCRPECTWIQLVETRSSDQPCGDGRFQILHLDHDRESLKQFLWLVLVSANTFFEIEPDCNRLMWVHKFAIPAI